MLIIFYNNIDKFGQDMLAAPIVTPVDNHTNTTTKEIWFPPGLWVNFFNLEAFTGPLASVFTFGLADIPLYVKAGIRLLIYYQLKNLTLFLGAIIPLKTMASVTNYTPDPLLFAIFPGADEGSTLYYEDDGETNDYLVFYYFTYKVVTNCCVIQNGQYAFTPISYAIQGTVTKVRSQPTIFAAYIYFLL